jgi:hypothetical protein
MISAEMNTVEAVKLDPSWPHEVGMILSALEAGCHYEDRRKTPRRLYNVKAELRLFTDPKDAPRRIIYTRDVNSKSMGFVTSHCLPLGYGGVIELMGFSGRIITIHCTLLRCRQAAAGWFEGALYFNREQWEFELE